MCNLISNIKKGTYKATQLNPSDKPITDIRYRLIDVFISGSTPEMRETIRLEFCKQNTNLRMIITTIAFGLGVDCSDITRMGPTSMLEELVQEIG